jgi:hypothetical protein
MTDFKFTPSLSNTGPEMNLLSRNSPQHPQFTLPSRNAGPITPTAQMYILMMDLENHVEL